MCCAVFVDFVEDFINFMTVLLGELNVMRVEYYER